eukprot:3225200-Prymnesium_polylepis.2
MACHLFGVLGGAAQRTGRWNAQCSGRDAQSGCGAAASAPGYCLRLIEMLRACRERYRCGGSQRRGCTERGGVLCQVRRGTLHGTAGVLKRCCSGL